MTEQGDVHRDRYAGLCVIPWRNMMFQVGGKNENISLIYVRLRPVGKEFGVDRLMPDVRLNVASGIVEDRRLMLVFVE